MLPGHANRQRRQYYERPSAGSHDETDDSYAGSETFYKLEAKLQELFGTEYFLPAHQGRACENIISRVFVKPDSVVPMNYHFTTTKSHITLNGGRVEEVFTDEALRITSNHPFKGNMDIDRLVALIKETGAENIPFVRMEAGTNLIGGQPFSLENLRQVRRVCDEYDIMLVLDASLLADNLYFIKQREESCRGMSIREITRAMAELCDIIYFSARKLGCARGGGICTDRADLADKMREFVPLYEGFLTYGGMSVREMEALTVGLEETMDEEMINQGPLFIKYMAEKLEKLGIPVVTPPGGLGCHVDAMAFVDHIPRSSIRQARWQQLSILPAVSGAWRGEPCPNKGMKTEARPCPIWNWCGWLCPAGCLPCPRSTMPWIDWPGCMRTGSLSEA